MRKTPALLAVALILPALTACSGGPLGGCAAPFSAGDATSLVTVSGEFASAPTIDFPTPLFSDGIQVETVIAGDGEPISDGQSVRAELTELDGSTGAILRKTSYAGEASGALFTVGSDTTMQPLTAALECATAGSRIVITASADDSEDAHAATGVGANDSVIYVVDIVDSYLAKADGAGQVPSNDDPTVIYAPDGTPGITIPKKQAPTELRTSVLKVGDGDEITEASIIVAKYTAVSWDSGKVTDSSWSTGDAKVLAIGNANDGVVEAVKHELIGHGVGSQLLIVTPAGEGGSGAVAYVVDILGIV